MTILKSRELPTCGASSERTTQANTSVAGASPLASGLAVGRLPFIDYQLFRCELCYSSVRCPACAGTKRNPLIPVIDCTVCHATGVFLGACQLHTVKPNPLPMRQDTVSAPALTAAQTTNNASSIDPTPTAETTGNHEHSQTPICATSRQLLTAQVEPYPRHE